MLKLYLLFFTFFIISCSVQGVSRKNNRIGDILFADPSTELVQNLDLKEYKKSFLGGMYWYKGSVSSDWFRFQVNRLEKLGYEEFKQSKNVDLEAKVFSKDECLEIYWHSVAKVGNHKRYSIYYQEDTEMLTLIWFSY